MTTSITFTKLRNRIIQSYEQASPRRRRLIIHLLDVVAGYGSGDIREPEVQSAFLSHIAGADPSLVPLAVRSIRKCNALYNPAVQP